jgi:hypothetical protein
MKKLLTLQLLLKLGHILLILATVIALVLASYLVHPIFGLYVLAMMGVWAEVTLFRS